MIRVASILICFVTISSAALAQGVLNPFNSSRPAVGGTIQSPTQKLPGFQASGGTEVLRHRSPLGTPCLTVLGEAHPHTINPNLYDHVIIATNSCAQQIALRVCYYQTDDCIAMEVPGNERKEATLGTLPSMKDFRFQFREKF